MRSGCRDFAGRADAFNEWLARFGEGAEVAIHLEAVPEGVGLAEDETIDADNE